MKESNMRKQNRIKWTAKILLFTLSLAPFLVSAQSSSVPPLINYQGRLTDAAGSPLNGTRNLTFNIYTNAVSGTNVWGPQVFNAVPVINGAFNVILGTTDTGGRSILDAFGGTNRYLGIKVDNGTEVIPRQQVLSAPYAVQAQNATYAVHGVPPGTIAAFWGSNAPVGWLLCNGAAVPAGTQYEQLRALVGSNVPDLRGMFLRGAGTHGVQTNAVGNRYAGGDVGTFEPDIFQGHYHEAKLRNGNAGTAAKATSNIHNTDYPVEHVSTSGNAIAYPCADATNGPPRWGSETKPASYSVSYIIKY